MPGSLGRGTVVARADGTDHTPAIQSRRRAGGDRGGLRWCTGGRVRGDAWVTKGYCSPVATTPSRPCGRRSSARSSRWSPSTVTTRGRRARRRRLRPARPHRDAVHHVAGVSAAPPIRRRRADEGDHLSGGPGGGHRAGARGAGSGTGRRDRPSGGRRGVSQRHLGDQRNATRAGRRCAAARSATPPSPSPTRAIRPPTSPGPRHSPSARSSRRSRPSRSAMPCR